MLAQALRTSPGMLSAIGLFGGFALIATGSLPLKVVGAILMLLAFFVPFIRMLVLPQDAPDPSSPQEIAGSTSAVAEDPKASRQPAGDTVRMQPTHSRPPRKDSGAAI